MKKLDKSIAWFFTLLVFVVGMIIGANLPSNTPTTDEYKQGFNDGYDYAVKTAQLTEDDGKLIAAHQHTAHIARSDFADIHRTDG